MLKETGAVTDQAKAIVVLPFDDVAQAEQFSRLVAIQHPDGHVIVTTGCAYTWKTENDAEHGQVIELFNGGGWESYVHPDDQHIVLERRLTTEPGSEQA